jgi:hypothetical protein
MPSNQKQKKRFCWKESRDETDSSLASSGLKLFPQPDDDQARTGTFRQEISPPNLLELNLVFATLQLTQLVALQRE